MTHSYTKSGQLKHEKIRGNGLLMLREYLDIFMEEIIMVVVDLHMLLCKTSGKFLYFFTNQIFETVAFGQNFHVQHPLGNAFLTQKDKPFSSLL